MDFLQLIFDNLFVAPMRRKNDHLFHFNLVVRSSMQTTLSGEDT